MHFQNDADTHRDRTQKPLDLVRAQGDSWLGQKHPHLCFSGKPVLDSLAERVTWGKRLVREHLMTKSKDLVNERERCGGSQLCELVERVVARLCLPLNGSKPVDELEEGGCQRPMRSFCFDKFALPVEPASCVNNRPFSLLDIPFISSVSIGDEIPAVVPPLRLRGVVAL